MEFIGGLSMLVGTIIGSGIFMSPSAILANVSSVGASLFIWIGCGILATMSEIIVSVIQCFKDVVFCFLTYRYFKFNFTCTDTE